MMFVKRLVCLLFFSVIVLIPFNVAAQLQRMAIASGQHNIPPSGSKSVDAYCLDYTRHAPSTGSQYGYLLSSPESAVVTLGNSPPIRLQDAINQGKVTIEGKRMTFSRLLSSVEDPMALSRMPSEAQREVAELRNMWSSLTEEHRRQFEARLAPLLGGDHTSLVFVNHTRLPISINLTRDAVVGSVPEPAPLINTEAITGPNRLTGQTEIQSQLWRAATKKHQAMLKDAGYYKGALNGEINEETANAIVKFKRDHNLGVDRTIDSETEVALISVSQESRNAKYVALTVDSGIGTQAAPLYHLYEPGGRSVYKGNEVSDLMAALNTERGRKGRGNNVYVVMKGFSVDKAEAFATSCRIHQRQIDSAVSIRSFYNDGASTKPEDFFFSAGKKFIDDSVTAPVLVTRGSNKNFYLSSFKVEDQVGEVGTVSVFARVKEVVGDFVEGAKSLFQIRQQQWSVSKIVNVARSRVKKKYGVSDDAIRIEFRHQFGGTQIVKLRGLIFEGVSVGAKSASL